MKPVDGVALCRVGAARLAFPCDEIEAITGVEGTVLDAALAFGDAATDVGRALLHHGRLLRVDSVDVLSTPSLAILPVPLALASHAALRGFIVLGDALWPLVSVPALLDHLDAGAAA